MSRRSAAGPSRPVAGLVAAALILVAGACGPTPVPRTPEAAVAAPAAPQPPPAPPAVPAPQAQEPQAPPSPTPSAALAAELSRVFEAPTYDRVGWGVLVQSLDSGEVLYAHNATKLMMPASNMKIVTLAAAAERLGWDFTYETQLTTRGDVVKGVLKGDLVVVGSGDPTIGSRGGPATRVFEAWADQLKAAGITAIDGRIVADARAFDPEPLGAGWAWDFLADSYAAGVSALQFSESTAEVVIRPGATAGAPAFVEVRPVESGLIPDKQVVTTAAGDPDIEVARLRGSNRLTVRGTIPAGGKEVALAATVDRPALYFARVLRSTLVQKGIRVSGDAGEFDDVYRAAPPEPGRVLLSHRSEPLSAFARVLMKVSQNQYAETLLRTLGAQAGSGTAAAGQKVVREVLDGWGIPQDAYALSDGSGLSRYNFVCAEMLTAILRRMYQDPKHRDQFIATLPVGGQDGTLARRFAGTHAAGNVKAKTGSISNVRALSGYVTSADGEPLVFSILANAFTGPSAVIDSATDAAVERLANFSRK